MTMASLCALCTLDDDIHSRMFEVLVNVSLPFQIGYRYADIFECIPIHETLAKYFLVRSQQRIFDIKLSDSFEKCKLSA